MATLLFKENFHILKIIVLETRFQSLKVSVRAYECMSRGDLWGKKQLFSLMDKELTISQLITKNKESSVADDSFKID